MSSRQGRWILIGLLGVSVFAGVISLPVTQAAPPAQGRLSFDDPSGMSGTLNDASPTANWSFDCMADGVGSVVVTTTSGDLAVDIAVTDAAGTAFAGGSQVSSGPNVSLVEAFTMPSTGSCGVQISRVSSTSGGYEVQLLPGFAHLEVWDQFDNSGALGLSWSSYTSDTLLVDLVNQQLQIQVLTDNLLGYAIPDEETTWGDFYIQADVVIEDSPSYAEYGFVLRLTTAENGDDNFYSFYFSTDGDFTVYYFNGDWQMVQDWTVSSAVPEKDRQARLGIMFQGNVMRAYYDGQFVGEVTDTVGYSSEGTVALAIGTMKDQTDALVVNFDNLVLTTPSKTGSALPFGGGATPQPTAAPAGGLLGLLGAATKPATAPTATTGFSFPTAPTATAGFALPTAPPAVPTATQAFILPTAPSSDSRFPQTLKNWNSANMADIVGELRQAGVVPSGGSMGLNVPSSYGDTSASGWSYYPLGQGNSFRNFVLSFDARQIFGEEGAGCGMFFRDTDTTSNDAIIFADGSALLAEWDADGNMADSSQLAAFEGVNAGVGSTNRVIVAANEATVLMYVNGQLFADTQFTPKSGGVALELYVPTNDAGQTQETYCQLNNIWLWSF